MNAAIAEFPFIAAFVACLRRDGACVEDMSPTRKPLRATVSDPRGWPTSRMLPSVWAPRGGDIARRPTSLHELDGALSRRMGLVESSAHRRCHGSRVSSHRGGGMSVEDGFSKVPNRLDILVGLVMAGAATARRQGQPEHGRHDGDPTPLLCQTMASPQLGEFRSVAAAESPRDT